MKIYGATQIKSWDGYTIKNEPISSIDLMERASEAFINLLKIPQKSTLHIFCGPGNNGGDGLAIARLLQEREHQVIVYVFKSKRYSEDYKTNKKRFSGNLKEISSVKDLVKINAKDIIIDAIFGSGLSKPIEGILLQIVEFINSTLNIKYAVDIPSGLPCDTEPQGEWISNCHTISFQQPKLNLLLPYSNLGSFTVADISLAKGFDTDTLYHYLTRKKIKGLITERSKFSHKGTYGHGLFIGGSYGKMGAAQLACKAALRSGIGLLTAFIPKSGYVVMQTAVPECMTITAETVQTVSSLPEIGQYNAIAIGPGLDTSPDCLETLAILLIANQAPLVIDADALNLIAANPHLMVHIPENSIFTPHPKEFDRLAGESKTPLDRLKKAIEFAKKHQIILVLKGAHTAVCLPSGEVFFNSSGNPGMATAGSGDVLTGILLGLLAQGYSPRDAALISVYKHGEAGDFSKEKRGEHATTASDLITHLLI